MFNLSVFSMMRLWLLNFVYGNKYPARSMA
jgi:hypothetical protein